MGDDVQQQISAVIFLYRVAKTGLPPALIALHKHAQLFEGRVLFKTVSQVSLLRLSAWTDPFLSLSEIDRTLEYISVVVLVLKLFLLVEIFDFSIGLLYELGVFALTENDLDIFMAGFKSTMAFGFGLQGVRDRELLVVIVAEPIEDERSS